MALLLAIAALWLTLVAVRFRSSPPVLLGGLLLVAAAALELVARGHIQAETLGLVGPKSWFSLFGLSIGWTVLMLLLTPMAIVSPPNLSQSHPHSGPFECFRNRS